MKNGSLYLRLLPIALMAAGSIANAVQKQQVTVPVLTGEGGDIVAVIPGEKELLWLLLMNAAFIIWNLLKDYWAVHKRKTDTSVQDIQEMKLALQALLHDVRVIKKTLDEVPNEKEVELQIYKIIHKGKEV